MNADKAHIPIRFTMEIIPKLNDFKISSYSLVNLDDNNNTNYYVDYASY